MTFEEDLKQIKDPAILKVGEYLKHRAASDHSVANNLAKENKSLSECWNFIKGQAKKKANHGCACIEDDEVFGWAVNYYDEDNIGSMPTVKLDAGTMDDVKEQAAKYAEKKKTEIKRKKGDPIEGQISLF